MHEVWARIQRWAHTHSITCLVFSYVYVFRDLNVITSPCPQVGLHGQELTAEFGPPVTLLTALPVGTGSLVDLEEGDEAGVTWGGGITLADSIAPHWFTPPEGMYVCFVVQWNP